LCVDERCTEDGVGFVDFKAVGAGILEVSKYEWNGKNKKKKEDKRKSRYQMNLVKRMVRE
jgi:hypothetical protein